MNPRANRDLAAMAPADVLYASETLDNLAAVRLTDQGWMHVQSVLAAMREAIRDRDAAAFSTSVGDLEIVSTDASSKSNFVTIALTSEAMVAMTMTLDALR